ncbi:hypothetical protein HMPREF0762_01430 [Slackia exigua ATCC 700122]|uniref:Uncharacterized protein n=1 Tax=Slackia exigua (strain ATCC 700122 / DSM 15923 / CIP 105133 / JCM 11022 / KCTC 5966 / S-7) TaxID=649764 RepID=D0WHV8_SLAES|nr:hypothetical protein HMPREF0762_01430 [Slackia exigua ATCC 700122]
MNRRQYADNASMREERRSKPEVHRGMQTPRIEKRRCAGTESSECRRFRRASLRSWTYVPVMSRA